jgi:hypothetical protein
VEDHIDMEVCCGMESIYVLDRSEKHLTFVNEFLYFPLYLGCGSLVKGS